MRRTAVFLVGLAICNAPHAQDIGGASFDCGKAAHPVEKLICGSPTLGRLDGEIARLYALEIKSYQDEPQALASYRDRHRKWLSQDRNRCTTVECLGTTMWGQAMTYRVSLERAGPSPAGVKETARNGIEVDKMLAAERLASTPAQPTPENVRAATVKRDVDPGSAGPAARAETMASHDRRAAEENADQVVRLRQALQVSNSASPTCQALASTWAGQLGTIRKYQDANLKGQAVGLVDGMIAEMRRTGCL